MTTEELRIKLVSGYDEALGNWLVSRLLDDEAKKLIKAQRAYWLNAPTDVLERLLGLYTETTSDAAAE